MIRKRIYEVIEAAHEDDRASTVYDAFMMIVIVVSLIPLAFKTEYTVFNIIDKVCAGIYIIDYILRLITADYKYNNKSILSFIRYPFSFMALIDLFSLLPSLTPMNSGFKVLRVMRMFRALRVLRVVKAARYSRSVRIIANVFRQSREPLAAVGTLAVAYILISALVIINVEPDSFDNFFDAVYWATVSLTTMGYGDIYPITDAGRLVGIVLAFLGVGIVAIPTGIISAGFVQQYSRIKDLEGTSEDSPIGFISVTVTKGHDWCDKKLCDIPVIEGMRILAILRDHQTVFPSGTEIILEGDRVIVGSVTDDSDITVSEVTIGDKSEWCDAMVSDFARHLNVVCILIIRDKERIIPTENTIIHSKDLIIVLRKNIRGIM